MTPNNRVTIMISEHDADDQFIFRKAIEEIDPSIGVLIFNNFSELKLFLSAENQNPPHMVLADLMSPFFELRSVSELRKMIGMQEIPVILFSEAHIGLCREKAMESGANDLFYKPSNINLLKGILTTVLKNHLEKQPSDEAAE